MAAFAKKKGGMWDFYKAPAPGFWVRKKFLRRHFATIEVVPVKAGDFCDLPSTFASEEEAKAVAAALEKVEIEVFYGALNDRTGGSVCERANAARFRTE